MSLFDWLLPKKKPARPSPESSGLSRVESTRPSTQVQAKARANGQPANRKSERIARRELLYTVVRDAMMRAGVLSSGYKFKVLSLDNRGTQFLVMIDLARGASIEFGSQAEVEAMIAQTAKARYQIVVTSVYWRASEHVATGGLAPAAGAKSPPIESASACASTPAPGSAIDCDAHLPVSVPAALESAPAPLEGAPAPLSRAGDRFDPIQDEEVEAFRKALAQGVSGQRAAAAPAGSAAAAAAAAAAATAASQQVVARDFDGSLKHGPQSYTLLTGFEDTELSEDSRPVPALSATQYGELR